MGRQMKAICFISLMLATVALLIFSVPVHASKADNRIEATARQSYIFKAFLQGDDIKIESRNGDVTLTGVVADNFNKSLAQETIGSIAGVKSVDNRLEMKGAPHTANSDAWIREQSENHALVSSQRERRQNHG